ncbi:diguanylate cyclase (GGDEF)-like protein [Massilia sp. UYP11]|uniref:putative bifunctional diguanylate cyclase/phosphodiesterase n=1 Tax=Massilia sp. UYP11 TaxID=1756385 RepID=UPI003D1EC055
MERYTDALPPSCVPGAGARQPAPAHLGDMLDSLTDGFMSIDRSWRFTYLNHTAERYLQRKRENLLGRDIWECFPDLVGSGYQHIYRQTAATGRPGQYTGYYPALGAWFEARSFAHDDGITVLFRDVTQEHEQAAELEFEARHDYLTGLYNRRECMEVLARAIADAGSAGATQGPTLAVLFIDLDHFKEVNDACGHVAGDGLLRDFASRLRALLDPDVFAARVGGDKFVLLLRNTTQDAAEALAHAVLGELAPPFETCGRSISLSASVGIALLNDASESAGTLLSEADTAMLAAKSSGRFQVRVYDEALDRGMRERLALRMDLPEAFAANQFQLHFQPKIAIADAAPIGAEALLRWRHPVRGLLGPQVFLDVLLKSPYEGVLVGWLLDAVCRQIEEWKKMEVPIARISFNLSPRQLLTVGLVDKILDSAAAHGVSPAMLDVEVTEDSLVGDIEKAMAVLAVLRQAGISTSLDDFGSGYSNLGYLVRLPIDMLKLDKSFVHALLDSDKASAVIRGIVALARSLGMKTIAEGVESQSQLAELQGIGCDLVQGNLFSRPLDSDAFAQFVLQRQ